MTRFAWAPFTFLVGLASVAAPLAHAQENALTLPTRTLSPVELASVEPLLDRAVVTHIESTEFVELPQVTVVGRANVSCDAVLAVARDVAAYPSFMPAIDTVAIESSAADVTSYEWTWQASVLSFRGHSVITTVADGDGASGFRMVYETHTGDLGRARRVLRGTPVVGDPSRCQLVLAGRHDVRDANYIARESAGSALTISRSLSLVLSIATVARLRGEAERRAGVSRPRIASPLGDPRSLSVDPSALSLLVSRGELFVLETTDGSDLGAIVGVTRLLFPADRVRHAFFDPVSFCVGLLHGASLTELSREEGRARYGWNVEVPFLGSSGELLIRDVTTDEVELEATSGAMQGGRIVLGTRPADGTNTFATLAARLDAADGVPIVAAIESTDPAFRPGLVASGLLMAFRGLRRGLNEGH
ncbi:MAG: hypothetical protein K1X94_01195 [Sandaracinaceae bacterium]|nr:hypothetical protein [Sandaracinaceae bacterium]